MLNKKLKLYLFISGIALMPVLLTGCSQEAVWDSKLDVGAISSSNVQATEAGQEILEAGGNAIDAAIAVSFALHVAEPHGSGIGGSGSMLIFPADGEPVYICYRDRAPAAAEPDMYLEASKSQGGLSISVPGQLRGMEKAHELFGTKDMADILAPAIKLADEGFPVTTSLSNSIINNIHYFIQCEVLSGIYMPDGFPAAEGDVIKQPLLANTITHFAENGFDTFYEGELAEAIVATVTENGGIMTKDDLKNYGEARVSSVLEGSFGPYTVYTSPLPNCGGVSVLQILNLWEHYPGEIERHPDFDEITYMAYAMGSVYSDREEIMGDPLFVEIDVEELLREDYLEAKASEILNRSFNFQGSSTPDSSTTNFVTADSEGNVVVVTQTIHSLFGSRLIVPEWGIIMNNGMNNFSDDPASPNAPEGSKIPASPMAATIILKDNEPVLALGAPGSMRIPSAVAQVALNYLERGHTLQEAIDEPRFHYQNDVLHLEERYSEEIKETFAEMGFDLNIRSGVASVTALGWKGGFAEAYADDRRGGGLFVR